MVKRHTSTIKVGVAGPIYGLPQSSFLWFKSEFNIEDVVVKIKPGVGKEKPWALMSISINHKFNFDVPRLAHKLSNIVKTIIPPEAFLGTYYFPGNKYLKKVNFEIKFELIGMGPSTLIAMRNMIGILDVLGVQYGTPRITQETEVLINRKSDGVEQWIGLGHKLLCDVYEEKRKQRPPLYLS